MQLLLLIPVHVDERCRGRMKEASKAVETTRQSNTIVYSIYTEHSVSVANLLISVKGTKIMVSIDFSMLVDV